jgi:hypothetical protein
MCRRPGFIICSKSVIEQCTTKGVSTVTHSGFGALRANTTNRMRAVTVSRLAQRIWQDHVTRHCSALQVRATPFLVEIAGTPTPHGEPCGEWRYHQRDFLPGDGGLFGPLTA